MLTIERKKLLKNVYKLFDKTFKKLEQSGKRDANKVYHEFREKIFNIYVISFISLYVQQERTNALISMMEKYK